MLNHFKPSPSRSLPLHSRRSRSVSTKYPKSSRKPPSNPNTTPQKHIPFTSPPRPDAKSTLTPQTSPPPTFEASQSPSSDIHNQSTPPQRKGDDKHSTTANSAQIPGAIICFTQYSRSTRRSTTAIGDQRNMDDSHYSSPFLQIPSSPAAITRLANDNSPKLTDSINNRLNRAKANSQATPFQFHTSHTHPPSSPPHLAEYEAVVTGLQMLKQLQQSGQIALKEREIQFFPPTPCLPYLTGRPRSTSPEHESILETIFDLCAKLEENDHATVNFLPLPVSQSPPPSSSISPSQLPASKAVFRTNCGEQSNCEHTTFTKGILGVDPRAGSEIDDDLQFHDKSLQEERDIKAKRSSQVVQNELDELKQLMAQREAGGEKK